MGRLSQTLRDEGERGRARAGRGREGQPRAETRTRSPELRERRQDSRNVKVLKLAGGLGKSRRIGTRLETWRVPG